MKLKFRLYDKQYKKFAPFYSAGTHCHDYKFIQENGEVISAVGENTDHEDRYSLSKNDYLNLETNNYEPRFRADVWTGLKDINGREIFENDTVVQYPCNRGKKWLEDGVYELTDERGPLDKTIVYEGVVKYCAPSFVIETFGGMGGVASAMMDCDGNYEIVEDFSCEREKL